MSVFAGGKISSLITGLSIFIAVNFAPFDVKAMSTAEMENEAFDVKQSISKWPKVEVLRTTEEKARYETTWNEQKTLRENQKELVMRFMQICCDFSFKRVRTGLKGIHLGKFETGEEVVFSEQRSYIYARPDLSKIMIYNENDNGKGLRVHLTTNLLPNVKPRCFKGEIKEEIREYITKLSEDSVGCEVLRLAIAKYDSGKTQQSKLKFIPVDKEEVGISYTTGSYVWKQMSLRGGVDMSSCENHSSRYKFVLISPDWMRKGHEGLVMQLEKNDTDGEAGEKLEIKTRRYPMEAGFLQQIIYALHSDVEKRYQETVLIGARAEKKLFSTFLRRIGFMALLCSELNTSIFANDEVYRAMFGLSEEGRESISEASYLSHRYKFIRPTSIGSRTKLKINGVILSQEEAYEFVKKFLESCGDYDLYKYYLSPESPIEYPEFGVGAYRCSNIDRKGKKPLL